LVLQPSYQAHGMRKSCREHTQNTKSIGEKWNRNGTNSVVALQDLSSYKVPTTHHHNKQKTMDQPAVQSSGKCVRFGAGRSRVRESYQDLVNWYCSLLTRRTVCGRSAGNTPRTQTNTEWNETINCTNSVVALQDHCSYKAPTTNHHNKKNNKKRWFKQKGATTRMMNLKELCS